MSYIIDALKRSEEKRLRRKALQHGALDPHTMANLQRLIDKYEKRMAELEVQIGALRHKHNVLLEATRLLQEEGLL
jgi:hypothetical protein